MGLLADALKAGAATRGHTDGPKGPQWDSLRAHVRQVAATSAATTTTTTTPRQIAKLEAEKKSPAQ